jgi:hypothetical protein
MCLIHKYDNKQLIDINTIQNMIVFDNFINLQG